MRLDPLDCPPELTLNPCPVCPHCGAEQGDPWDLGLGDGDATDADCQSCGRPFAVGCEVSVTYSTRKLEEGEPDD